VSIQAGIWNIDGKPADGDSLANISRALAEYGPDGENIFSGGPIELLYRPFHTTAESRLEKQPYVFANGKVITWDGRLDNRSELTQQLKGALKTDNTDLSLVAAAFETWGVDCFSRLIGDWAVSVWNPQERELILARDYIGIRHLFYYPTQKRLLWCSHLAPLALCGEPLTVCDEYIAGYFAFHPDAHLTPYREVRSVPPGQFVRIHRGSIKSTAYWNFDVRLRTRYKTDAEYEEHFRHLFRQAVRRRLRADSPILAELSGGLDSSSIVSMADDILAKEGAETPRIDTFSYYDSKEPGEDDLEHLAKVEEKRGKDGFHADLRGSGNSLAFDYPVFVPTPGFGSRAEIRTALSNVIQQRGCRVALSGTGGDEMNGQPLDPRVQMADLLLACRLPELIKQLTIWSLLIRRPLLHLLFQTAGLLLPLSLRSILLRAGRVEPWLDRKFVCKYRISARQLEAVEGYGFLRPSVRDSLQTITTLARLMTYMSPSGIERRYPYLDQNLVEFLTTIPLDQLLRPGQRRCLMRRALVDILPQDILARKTKTGASRCYSIALQEHWSTVESIFRSPLTSRLGYVNRDKVLAALLATRDGQISPTFLQLLKALSLELWLRDVERRGVVTLRSVLAPHEWKLEKVDVPVS